MKAYNKAMKQYLSERGIKAKSVKFIEKGSLKGCWIISNYKQKWTQNLIDRFDIAGFKDFDGKKLGEWSGNGGIFSVYVTKNINLGQPQIKRQY